jgi:hypothetical protein
LLLLSLLSAAVRVAAAEERLEFAGVLVLPKQTTVRLVDKSSGVSAWIPLGQAFEGYVVTAYEAKEETVVLAKDGTTLRIRLDAGKVKEGGPEPTPAVTPQQQRAILNHLRQIAAAADQYYLENGANHVTLAELVGPDKYIKEIVPVAGEDYSQIDLKQGKPLTIALPGGGAMTYTQ